MPKTDAITARLDELQALCDAAPSAPWTHDAERNETRHDENYGWYDHVVRAPGATILIGYTKQKSDNVGDFIAASRTAMPQLVAALVELCDFPYDMDSIQVQGIIARHLGVQDEQG